MKTSIKFLTLLCISLVVFMSSCTKEGPIGPIGPAGIDGIDGTNGIDGANGVDGADGNANVSASQWFPLSFIKTVTNGIPQFDSNISVPEITSEIVDQGVVLVYGKLNGYVEEVWPRDHVAQFPITVMYNALGNTQINTYKAFITVGNLRVNITENFDIHDGTGPAHRFRYVIIPSNATSGKNAHLNFHKMSYEEVMDYFGLDY